MRHCLRCHWSETTRSFGRVSRRTPLHEIFRLIALYKSCANRRDQILANLHLTSSALLSEQPGITIETEHPARFGERAKTFTFLKETPMRMFSYTIGAVATILLAVAFTFTQPVMNSNQVASAIQIQFQLSSTGDHCEHCCYSGWCCDVPVTTCTTSPLEPAEPPPGS